jgi:hypothetical protein
METRMKMKVNKYRIPFVQNCLTACIILKLAVSAMATSYWTAEPALDVAGEWGVTDDQCGTYAIAANNGFLYEFTYDSSEIPKVYRWSDMQGWQCILTFCQTNSVEYPFVNAMVIKSNSLYFGGYFDGVIPSAGGVAISVHNIAGVNLSTLACFQVGDGSITDLDDSVVAITVDNKTNVYAALNVYGLETNDTNLPFKNDPLQLIKSHGTNSWNELGNGLCLKNTVNQSYQCQFGGGVEALATDGTNVFAGGMFLGGTNSNNSYVPSGGIIKWDGTNWHTMGNTAMVQGVMEGGIFDPVYANATFFVSSVAVSGTNVFATGQFVGSNPNCNPNDPETCDVYSSAGQGLARFSTAGNLIETNILYYEGTNIEANAWGWDLAVQPNGTVYLVGQFVQIDETTNFQFIAQWKNGQGWSKLDSVNGDLSNGVGRNFYLAADANEVFVYGTFDQVGNIPVTANDGWLQWARWVTGSTNPAPTITTFIGTSAGLEGPTGISINRNTMLIADSGGSQIDEASVSTGSCGPISSGYGISASSPFGVAMDNNDYVYLGDADYGEIREFQGGDNPIELDNHMGLGITLDYSEKHLYCIQGENDNVVKLDCVEGYGGPSDGIVTPIAGNGTVGYSGDDGPATNAELNVDIGYIQAGYAIYSSLTVDSQDNVYIADIGNNVVRKVTAATGIISTVAGNNIQGYSGDGGQAISAELSHPAAVAMDPQLGLFIADSSNNVVRLVDLNGNITTVAGTGTGGYSGDGGPAKNAKLNSPAGLTIDSSGNLYISDTGNNVIRKITF